MSRALPKSLVSLSLRLARLAGVTTPISLSGRVPGAARLAGWLAFGCSSLDAQRAARPQQQRHASRGPARPAARRRDAAGTLKSGVADRPGFTARRQSRGTRRSGSSQVAGQVFIIFAFFDPPRGGAQSTCIYVPPCVYFYADELPHPHPPLHSSDFTDGKFSFLENNKLYGAPTRWLFRAPRKAGAAVEAMTRGADHSRNHVYNVWLSSLCNQPGIPAWLPKIGTKKSC